MEHADFSRVERCLPLITLCVGNDDGAMKAISSSLAGIVPLCIAIGLAKVAKHFNRPCSEVPFFNLAFSTLVGQVLSIDEAG